MKSALKKNLRLKLSEYAQNRNQTKIHSKANTLLYIHTYTRIKTCIHMYIKTKPKVFDPKPQRETYGNNKNNKTATTTNEFSVHIKREEEEPKKHSDNCK